MFKEEDFASKQYDFFDFYCNIEKPCKKCCAVYNSEKIIVHEERCENLRSFIIEIEKLEGNDEEYNDYNYEIEEKEK